MSQPLVEREHAAGLHGAATYQPPHCRGCFGDQAQPEPPTQTAEAAQAEDAQLAERLAAASSTKPPTGPLPRVASTGALSLGEAIARGEATARKWLASRKPQPTPQEDEPTQPETPPCATCADFHYVRPDGWRPELPPGHPLFGRLEACPSCHRPKLVRHILAELVSGSQVPELYRDATLATFPGTPRSRPAFEAVSQWWQALQDGRPVSPGLYLWGDSNVGKSTLAASVLNEWNAREAELALAAGREPLQGAWLFVEDLLEAIRGTFSGRGTRTAAEIEHAVGSTPFVVLDDLGGEQTKPWVAAKLLQMIGHRHDSRLPTIFTSMFAVEGLEQRMIEGQQRRFDYGGEPLDDESSGKRVRATLWRIVEMSQIVEVDGENLRDPHVRQRLGLGPFVAAPLHTTSQRTVS